MRMKKTSGHGHEVLPALADFGEPDHQNAIFETGLCVIDIDIAR
jgi:hypothetical protein